MVTWDEEKRQTNLRRHGLDFIGCEAVFDGPVITAEDSRWAYGEQRINLLGWLRDRVVHMTYTERGDDCPEVVEYFRATGKGWQTRMDEALKDWVEAHRT